MLDVFPGGSDDKESACNAGDQGLIPGLGKSPWRRERLPTSVFWPREFHGLYSPQGRKESDMAERANFPLHTLYDDSSSEIKVSCVVVSSMWPKARFLTFYY